MAKFLALFLGIMLFAQNVYSQDENFDYILLNQQLDKITQQLDEQKLSSGMVDDILKLINDKQDELNLALSPLNTELESIQKKIEALGDVSDSSGEIAKQMKLLTKQADELKTSLAQIKLAKTKIDDINALILKLRNQDLFDRIFVKQSSIFHPHEFFVSLASFFKFSLNLLHSPFVWYQKLSADKKIIADNNIIYAFFYILMAILIAAYLQHFIKTKFGCKDDVNNPNYSQKVRAALWMFLARGLFPAATIGSFMFWIKSADMVNKSDFGIMLFTLSLYLLYFFLIRALVKSLFTPDNIKWRIIEVCDIRATLGSRALIFSAALICIVSFFQSLAEELNVEAETLYSLKIFANAVKAFCVIWVSNKFLFDCDNDTTDDDNDNEPSTEAKISLIIMIIMILAFVLSLFGYIRLSEFVINHFILSAVVIAAAYILDRLLRAIFRQIMKLKFWNKNLHISPRKLVKTNFWFALILSPLLGIATILALLALWGVSVDIMLNKTSNFLNGFNIGGLYISISSIVLGIISFLVSSFLFKLLARSLQNGSLSQIDWRPGVKNSVVSAVGFFGVIISLVVGFAVMGGSIKSLAIIAGALSLGAGLGLQNMVSNLVAGLTILFERQIKVGDWVIIDGQEGIVKKINMRSTELETWNKSNVIVPNAIILSQSFVNKTFSDRMGRVEIKVAVDFDTDIPLVKNLLLNIAENDPDVLKSPPPSLLFTDLTDNSLVFQLNCYTANVYNCAAISFRIRKQIVESFRENNIVNPQTVVQSIIVSQNS